MRPQKTSRGRSLRPLQVRSYAEIPKPSMISFAYSSDEDSNKLPPIQMEVDQQRRGEDRYQFISFVHISNSANSVDGGACFIAHSKRLLSMKVMSLPRPSDLAERYQDIFEEVIQETRNLMEFKKVSRSSMRTLNFTIGVKTKDFAYFCCRGRAAPTVRMTTSALRPGSSPLPELQSEPFRVELKKNDRYLIVASQPIVGQLNKWMKGKRTLQGNYTGNKAAELLAHFTEETEGARVRKGLLCLDLQKSRCVELNPRWHSYNYQIMLNNAFKEMSYSVDTPEKIVEKMPNPASTSGKRKRAPQEHDESDEDGNVPSTSAAALGRPPKRSRRVKQASKRRGAKRGRKPNPKSLANKPSTSGNKRKRSQPEDRSQQSVHPPKRVRRVEDTQFQRESSSDSEDIDVEEGQEEAVGEFPSPLISETSAEIDPPTGVSYSSGAEVETEMSRASQPSMAFFSTPENSGSSSCTMTNLSMGRAHVPPVYLACVVSRRASHSTDADLAKSSWVHSQMAEHISRKINWDQQNASPDFSVILAEAKTELEGKLREEIGGQGVVISILAILIANKEMHISRLGGDEEDGKEFFTYDEDFCMALRSSSLINLTELEKYVVFSGGKDVSAKLKELYALDGLLREEEGSEHEVNVAEQFLQHLAPTSSTEESRSSHLLIINLALLQSPNNAHRSILERETGPTGRIYKFEDEPATANDLLINQSTVDEDALQSNPESSNSDDGELEPQTETSAARTRPFRKIIYNLRKRKVYAQAPAPPRSKRMRKTEKSQENGRSDGAGGEQPQPSTSTSNNPLSIRIIPSLININPVLNSRPGPPPELTTTTTTIIPEQEQQNYASPNPPTEPTPEAAGINIRVPPTTKTGIIIPSYDRILKLRNSLQNITKVSKT